jgi:ATP-dependent helicase/nuclease subunit A
LRPSKLADAPAQPRAQADNSQAQQRGIALHRLLEVLPDVAKADRAKVAQQLLKRFALDDATKQDITMRIAALLDDPQFAPLFSGAALVEAPISALLPDGSVLAGQMDRLLIDRHEILVVDYKSGHQIPATPDAVPAAYLKQMAAYRWALQQIWSRPVRTALLWVDAPLLMPLPDALLPFSHDTSNAFTLK